jgi:hypothetical protein
MSNGTVIHARNLDFDFPTMMSRLVYRAILQKNGRIVGEAVAIAGYIGFYTGIAYDKFTVSYNVRMIRTNISDIMINIEDELKNGIVPAAQVIERALLSAGGY